MKKKILTSVVCGIAGISCFPATPDLRPKLVVGIVVDQLRTDYVEYLQDIFSPGGFKRLMRDGAYLRDLDFKVPAPDIASATAIIQTGSYPRQNGVSGAYVYNSTDKSISPIFTDAAYIGNFSSETLSPAAMRVTTISDELQAGNNYSSSVHAVSPDASQAIILAGHDGSSAFWINDNTGKWSSTTYYTASPSLIQNRNYNNPLVSRLDTMKWQPLLRGVQYPDIPVKKVSEGFKYLFSRSDRDVYSLYKASPLVNREITEIAVDYIKDLNLGHNPDATDMLGIGFTLAPYPNVSSGDGRYELEDAYVRLDKNIESILNAIDKYVGMENALVYITSTGYYADNQTPSPSSRIPGGTFSVKRAVSLLNSYLAAKFGNGSYIDTYYDGHIFLDKSTIEEKNLNLNDIAEESRDFLVRMSGVGDAYTIRDLMSPAVPQLEGHRLASDPKTSGDIIIEFNPGWIVTDDTRYPAIDKRQIYTVFESPAFIFGGNIAPQVIDTPVDAAAIAPTISKALKIRAPNATTEKPINLKNKFK